MIEEGEASHFSGCKRQRRLVTGKSQRRLRRLEAEGGGGRLCVVA
jgi:hypothetical protein